MDGLAGGAAIQRFAHTVLWLEHHDPKVVLCGEDLERLEDFMANRTLHILKARNGRGAGRKVGFWFYDESLTLQELGVIHPDQGKDKSKEN